ncbi:MAG: hypothetical protein ACRYFX_05735 [Janthinobacterium lividum]
MRVNHDPAPPLRLPNILDFATLTTTLLRPELVALVPLAELARRCQEINATHPHYQEETPLVLRLETQRRQRLSGALVAAVNEAQVA